MISSVSQAAISYVDISRTNRDVVNIVPESKIVNVEKINIQKDVITTNIINKEQANYIYNIQNRTIHQPVNELGSVINIYV